LEIYLSSESGPFLPKQGIQFEIQFEGKAHRPTNSMECGLCSLLALAMKRGLGRWAPLALAPALTGAVDVRGVAPSEQAVQPANETVKR